MVFRVLSCLPCTVRKKESTRLEDTVDVDDMLSGEPVLIVGGG